MAPTASTTPPARTLRSPQRPRPPRTEAEPRDGSRRGLASFVGDEDGVSEVIGNVMMIGITVGLVVALLVLVVTFSPPSDPLSADLKVVTSGSDVDVRHVAGEPVRRAEGTFLMEVDGRNEARELDDPAFDPDLSPGDPDAWEIGESVCLSCLFPGETIDRVTFVARNEVLMEWERA